MNEHFRLYTLTYTALARQVGSSFQIKESLYDHTLLFDRDVFDKLLHAELILPHGESHQYAKDIIAVSFSWN